MRIARSSNPGRSTVRQRIYPKVVFLKSGLLEVPVRLTDWSLSWSNLATSEVIFRYALQVNVIGRSYQ